MSVKFDSSNLKSSPQKYFLIGFVILGLFVSSCNAATPTPPAVTDVPTSEPQVSEPAPTQEGTSDLVQLAASDSDRLGFCFSYPAGYTQLPSNDMVEVVSPEIPGTDLRPMFWIETGDPYNRTAQVIAEQDMQLAGIQGITPISLTVGGEQAVALDGMPGQDMQRRVYVVHGQKLYVLAFMPTRSENAEASAQMEALYSAVINSWAWTPCSAQ